MRDKPTLSARSSCEILLSIRASLICSLMGKTMVSCRASWREAVVVGGLLSDELETAQPCDSNTTPPICSMPRAKPPILRRPAFGIPGMHRKISALVDSSVALRCLIREAIRLLRLRTTLADGKRGSIQSSLEYQSYQLTSGRAASAGFPRSEGGRRSCRRVARSRFALRSPWFVCTERSSLTNC